jgi:hypothetical protein
MRTDVTVGLAPGLKPHSSSDDAKASFSMRCKAWTVGGPRMSGLEAGTYLKRNRQQLRTRTMARAMVFEFRVVSLEFRVDGSVFFPQPVKSGPISETKGSASSFRPIPQAAEEAAAAQRPAEPPELRAPQAAQPASPERAQA